jgi:hypothetical protein
MTTAAPLPTHFSISLNGQIESAQMGTADNVYLRYWFTYGEDWVVAGEVCDLPQK